jgi:branched-chain amino acid transport system ATP-binding protein
VKSKGSIRSNSEEIGRERPHVAVGRGLCHVPEGRMVFAILTVRENLNMSAYLQWS